MDVGFIADDLETTNTAPATTSATPDFTPFVLPPPTRYERPQWPDPVNAAGAPVPVHNNLNNVTLPPLPSHHRTQPILNSFQRPGGQVFDPLASVAPDPWEQRTRTFSNQSVPANNNTGSANTNQRQSCPQLRNVSSFMRTTGSFGISVLDNVALAPAAAPPPPRRNGPRFVPFLESEAGTTRNLQEVLALLGEDASPAASNAQQQQSQQQQRRNNTLPALGNGGGAANIGIAPNLLPQLPNPSSGESRKRKRSTSFEMKKEDVKNQQVEKEEANVEDNDENCCTICLEPWTSSGKHQLSCLPCGHLFGRSCIDTWLRRKRVCPNCKISMRGKKATLIFGAPAKLQAVDLGELATLRDELDKERKDHERTKKRMKEYREHANSLKTRLRMYAAPQFGGPPASLNGPTQSLLRLSQVGRSTTATTAARGGGAIGSFEGRLRRAFREPIQDTSDLPISAPISRTILHPIPVRNSATTPSAPPSNAAPVPHSSTVPRSSTTNVNMVINVDTNGGSKALAFDEVGNVLFSEKRQMRLGDSAPQKVSRRPLMHAAVRVQSRAEFFGRINDLAVSRFDESPFRGHIAVANQSKRLHVLSSSLDEVLNYSTVAVPLSCWWSTTQPNLLVSGLMNGMVCAFDIRNTAGPLATKKVLAPGNIAVHSLAEVVVQGNPTPVLLAGTPARIEAITFGAFAGTMSMEQVRRGGVAAEEMCCSLTVDGQQVLVSSRQTRPDTPGNYGRHIVHQGVNIASGESSNALELGPSLASDNGLTGHRMTTLYERAALLCGNGYGGDGTVVMSPDTGPGINKYTRSWEYSRGAWSSSQVSSYVSRLSTMVVKATPLAPEQHARIGRGVAAHLGDSTLQVFSVANSR